MNIVRMGCCLFWFGTEKNQLILPGTEILMACDWTPKPNMYAVAWASKCLNFSEREWTWNGHLFE